ADGLALSSRNQYLSAAERETAPVLHAELQRLAQQLMSNKLSMPEFEALLAETSQRISNAGFNIDYLEVKTDALKSVINDAEVFNVENENLIILVAAW
ncbi:pantoate--beta-alanine ligase, partial [Pseudomonas sp. HY2-MNA-CIBAN-0224]